MYVCVCVSFQRRKFRSNSHLGPSLEESTHFSTTECKQYVRYSSPPGLHPSRAGLVQNKYIFVKYGTVKVFVQNGMCMEISK